MTTFIGIAIIVVVFAVRYGGSALSGLGWLWSKLPSLPSLPIVTTRSATTDTPTAAQAFAALEVIARFKAGSSADPSYGMVIAALKHTQEAA